MNIDQLLITYCAPTLARLKMGALLCLHRAGTKEQYEASVARYNEQYNHKGLYFRILYQGPQRTLLDVYRPDMVEAYLRQADVARFLANLGYTPEAPAPVLLNHLADRFANGGCFPHESGIFLGYPLADVIGFIRHKGSDAKLCGEWKVYGDAEQAAALFQAYSSCRAAYENSFVTGTALEKLIVA